MIDLQNPRLRLLTFSLLLCSISSFSPRGLAQSETTEFRPSDGAVNTEFDERETQALVQWVQQKDPQLWQILVEWEQTTRNYKKLSGEHRRYVYDSVFQVEKRSDGKFFYEAPDKGRIDISAVEIPAGAKSQKISPQGKPYSLKSDIPEIWICDGKRIAQGTDNGVQKFYTIFQIPEMNQGANIMDGPLPFLFGLPATQAVQRYNFTLLPNTDQDFIWLHVLPKREQDQRNWKEAQVILDRKMYLPKAVKLKDPAGTTETVYSFSELKVNRNAILELIFDRDWDVIEKVLKDYKLIKDVAQGRQPGGTPEQPGRAPLQPNAAPQPRPQQNVADGNQLPQKVIMPNVLNADWKFVQKIFTERGFEPEFRKAGPAPSAEQVYKVAKTEPQQGAELNPGQKVIFYLYEEVQTTGRP